MQKDHIHWVGFIVIAFFATFFLTRQINLTYLPELSINTSEAATDPATEPLLQQSDLTYLGAFRTPALPYNSQDPYYTFNYSVAGLAFNPANNSLFINTHWYSQRTGEISIPSLSKNLSSLSRAALLQTPYDITEGNLGNVLAGGAKKGRTITFRGRFFFHTTKTIN